MDNTISGSNAVANVNSSLAVRSNRGCWTCRIRKKKCDELKPGCLRCADVNVECRYGPKPNWIDDPKFGKIELERIKAIVAASASKKRAAFRARKNSNSTSSLLKSPKSSSTTKSPRKESNLSSIDNVVSKSIDMEMVHDKTIEPESCLFPKWIEDQEASLMMHYLDHVFFIQFRFHTPSLSSGRGWLLSLLIRTKPLYHAALSLSAFHRQSLLLEQESGQAEIDYLHELRHHHDLTLKELRNFIQTNNKNVSEQRAFDGNVQILACMIQLISFELFHGGVSNWQVHLRAASELILILHEVSNGSIPTSETLTSSQCFDYSYAHSPESTSSGNTVSRDSAALDFFTGAIIWIDALSCVSTGSHPWLSEFHNQLLSAKKSDSSKSDHKIQLTSIMGCENWVMIMISEIAWLGTWRRKHEEEETINSKEQLIITQQNIRNRLESKNSETLKELIALRATHHGSPPHYHIDLYNKHTIYIVTHIFASAALIYLQMAVTDNIAPEDIDILLHNTINAMRMIPDPQMFRGLVWPLSVAGCLASSKTDQEFFREIIGGVMVDVRSFGNMRSVLEILERSWGLQREGGGRLVDCTRTIGKLGACVLLV
ncbi:64585307-f8cb-4a19-bfa8-82eaea6783ff [Sclerotinia trifoliorum]|uniref:64585307-f8cb-4a19-bfa8-82eaea6783ff n=1 Tax=Sclerotinia trifoliorum TaxID=28548 RepID=A0A8H2VL15_9HELO|nr:64585307-f8cb-4a19-bfa8-82eaea6783ff [Sclerotinia trifoliorum]